MKALVTILVIAIASMNMHANNNSFDNGNPKKNTKEQELKTALDRQVNRHIFNPVQGESSNLKGKADVMLEVLPKGDIQVVLIQTANPLMKYFIEKQVKKMKVNTDEVIVGEIFKYRFVFKAKE